MALMGRGQPQSLGEVAALLLWTRATHRTEVIPTTVQVAVSGNELEFS
jgi:hypothetical protein